MMKRVFLCILLGFSFVYVSHAMSGDTLTYAQRFTAFVDSVSLCDTLSVEQKAKVDSTYKAYLAEYKVAQKKMSDEDVRKYSKAKVKYQKAMARIFVNNTSDDVSDAVQNIGKKVSKTFKKTAKKIQGAFDALKDKDD